jgi:hypothetical protein
MLDEETRDAIAKIARKFGAPLRSSKQAGKSG